ncbi:ribonuclease P protein component [Litorimonas taeanensis]|uniref:Ribonuclease P protein component n=1 Tax=Litorimonas taeanensis TaxID=568099 RepID=A0A420WE27_9PROT|nr:ribonuclease P protein component [Litorimonas taeanensis]RKQ69238.1 ribonuclease P protein component [Litorimonas taeanensis]
MTGASKEISKLGVLKKRAEFLYVRNGVYRAQGGLVIQMRANPEQSGLRVGFTATKKIGNAVRRNRAKRRMRELARALLPQYGLAGHDYVFIARDNTTTREWTALLDDAQKALITLGKRHGPKNPMNSIIKDTKKADR